MQLFPNYFGISYSNLNNIEKNKRNVFLVLNATQTGRFKLDIKDEQLNYFITIF